MNKLRAALAIACFSGIIAAPAMAGVIFLDNTFNPANYSQSSVYLSSGGVSFAGSQCASCGDGGGVALQFVANLPDSTSAIQEGAQAWVNNTFSYNPATEGAIASITASVDKNLSITLSGGPFGNTFRPTIEQDGIFYVAAIPGPTYSGGTTGFQTLSESGLTAASFLEFDFSTGTFGTANPNFAGDTMLFGLTQISNLGGDPPAVITAVYNSLSFDIETPEPASLYLGGLGLTLLAGAALRRKLA